MFYCEIDIAKYKHEASVIDINGKALIDSISFTNDKQGCEKVLTVLGKLEIAPADIIIGMEATGHYWISVYTFFLELGYTVKVINPISPKLSEKCISVRSRMTPKIHISSLRLCVSENTPQLYFLRKISLFFHIKNVIM